MIGTLIAVLVNLVTNYIFIKLYCFVAAAYTTLFSYVCYLVLHIVISKRLVNFEVVNWRGILISAVIVAVIEAIDLFFVRNTMLWYVIYT